MSPFSRRALFWAPRAISIAFIVFLSLFALDVFAEGRGFWDTLLALSMHLVPSLILLAALVLAWRWEWIGAAAYAAVGTLYVIWVFGRPIPPATRLNWILTIALPAFAIAALFLVNWWKHSELQPKT